MDFSQVSLPSSTFVKALVFSAICGILSYVRRSTQPPYPPGPKGYWLLGLVNIPLIKPWLTYEKWGKQYGELIHFTRFGKHYLVINSLEAANEILESQARLTSDRPARSKLDQIAGWDRTLVMSPYDDKWRKYRKLFHQNFRADVSTEYQPIEIKQVQKFLEAINSSDMSLRDQISTLSQIVMFNAIYGLDIATNKEDMSQHARDIIDLNDFLFLPGWDAFKYIPFIHLLPSWLPGGQYRVAHEKIDETLGATIEGPWLQTLSAMKSDKDHSSLVAKLITEKPEGEYSAEDMDRIKNMGMQAVAAAADTTMSAICTFFLAMGLYPEVQLKAQQELDCILGPGKLPKFSDRSSLPYVEAVYREVMRWHPALPVGVPHASIADVYYKGYYIPQGTIISANIWAMTHDESTFESPGHDFIPERHLGKNENINSILAYGFGRRVCSGRYMAHDTTWITIASVLVAMEITIDTLPHETLEDYFSDGSFCSTKSLDYCKVKPRFP